MTDQPATQAIEPDDVDAHVCKPGASVYYCPTGGETESDCHGGFDVCCARPDLHQSLLKCSRAQLHYPHGPHSWEPQPGMNPVHCEGYGNPGAADRPALENLDAAPAPARWCCDGNAEDCSLCTDPNPDYPWTCPGHPDTAANRQRVRAATQAGEAVCTVTVTVHAPTEENAASWAQTISDLVSAEYGQEMRLNIQIDRPRKACCGKDIGHHIFCPTRRTEEK
ncbi:hypothetical protein ACFWH4_01150 [Streptomyces sp. NPDC127091]|uniref:hypothetical protein n=1 Tax=Streptomyces sp. NPDC127091 TaxID=3347134 RepID=UPI0036605818